MTPPVDDFPCNVFVEVVTDYFEGVLLWPTNPAGSKRTSPSVQGARASSSSSVPSSGWRAGWASRMSTPCTPAQREPVMAAFRAWAAGRN